MSIADILHTLEAQGARFQIIDGHLKVTAPKEVLSQELKAILMEQRYALAELLSETCIHCRKEITYYSDTGVPYCTLHRYQRSTEQSSTCPALQRITQTDFFLQDLAEIRAELYPKRQQLCIDLKTTDAQGPNNAKVVSITVGWPDNAFVLDMRPYYSLTSERQLRWREALGELLQQPDVLWIGHHLKRVWSLLATQFGIRLPKVYDTMLIEQLIHGVGPNDRDVPVKLRSTARRYGIAISEDNDDWFAELAVRGIDWEAPFPPAQLAFLSHSIDGTYRICQFQRPYIQQNQLKMIKTIENQTLPALTAMEIHGVLIDQELWRTILEQKYQRQLMLEDELKNAVRNAMIEKYPLGIEATCRTYQHYQQAWQTEVNRLLQSYQMSDKEVSWERFFSYHIEHWRQDHPEPPMPVDEPPELNLRSPIQLLSTLNALGIPVLSTGKEALEPYTQTCPIVEKLLQWKELQKFNSSFGENILKMIDADGRLRGDFVQIGAVSGRIICRHPNLQQIPAKAESEAENIRRCFIAPHGYKLLKADLSNIELRILAEIAQDTVMLKLFEQGADLHAETAKLMFNLPAETDTRKYLYKDTYPVRDIAKTINYGLAYGMGARGLADRIGISVEGARSLMETYFKTYTGLANWLRHIGHQSLNQGYAVTLGGRRRPYIVDHTTDCMTRGIMERSAKNHPIQGTNADILKRALYLLYERLPSEVSLVLAIHDEILLEAPDYLVPEAVQILKEMLMQACRDFLKAVAIPEIEVIVDTYWRKE